MTQEEDRRRIHFANLQVCHVVLVEERRAEKLGKQQLSFGVPLRVECQDAVARDDARGPNLRNIAVVFVGRVANALDCVGGKVEDASDRLHQDTKQAFADSLEESLDALPLRTLDGLLHDASDAAGDALKKLLSAKLDPVKGVSLRACVSRRFVWNSASKVVAERLLLMLPVCGDSSHFRLYPRPSNRGLIKYRYS